MYQKKLLQVFFGVMNEFETSNKTSKLANEQLLSALDAKQEKQREFCAAGIAHNVKTITDNFF
jgi:hypothetical protein